MFFLQKFDCGVRDFSVLSIVFAWNQLFEFSQSSALASPLKRRQWSRDRNNEYIAKQSPKSVKGQQFLESEELKVHERYFPESAAELSNSRNLDGSGNGGSGGANVASSLNQLGYGAIFAFVSAIILAFVYFVYFKTQQNFPSTANDDDTLPKFAGAQTETTNQKNNIEKKIILTCGTTNLRKKIVNKIVRQSKNKKPTEPKEKEENKTKFLKEFMRPITIIDQSSGLSSSSLSQAHLTTATTTKTDCGITSGEISTISSLNSSSSEFASAATCTNDDDAQIHKNIKSQMIAAITKENVSECTDYQQSRSPEAVKCDMKTSVAKIDKSGVLIISDANYAISRQLQPLPSLSPLTTFKSTKAQILKPFLIANKISYDLPHQTAAKSTVASIKFSGSPYKSIHAIPSLKNENEKLYDSIKSNFEYSENIGNQEKEKESQRICFLPQVCEESVQAPKTWNEQSTVTSDSSSILSSSFKQNSIVIFDSNAKQQAKIENVEDTGGGIEISMSPSFDSLLPVDDDNLSPETDKSEYCEVVFAKAHKIAAQVAQQKTQSKQQTSSPKSVTFSRHLNVRYFDET